jgi:hypothetical protein
VVDGEVRSELALFAANINDGGRECSGSAQPESGGGGKPVWLQWERMASGWHDSRASFPDFSLF